MILRSLSAWVAVLSVAGIARADWPEGQVVTWADFSYVNHIAASAEVVYFATTEGITRYDKLRDRWLEPLTGTPGLGDQNVERVWVDILDENLYVQAAGLYYEYDRFFDSWSQVPEPPAVENVGVHVRAPAVMFPPPEFNYSGDGRIIDPSGRYFVLSDVLDDQSGELWVGTWGYGAARAGRSSSAIELLPYGLLQSRVNAMVAVDSDLWLSGANLEAGRTGISIFLVDDNTFRHIESGLINDFPSEDVNCLMVDSSTIYVGTPVGLLCMDREGYTAARRFTTASGLADDNVLSLAGIGDSLLVGTAAGLSLIAPYADSATYVRPRHLEGLVVYDIEVVGSAAWIATSNGAYRLQFPDCGLQRFLDPEGNVGGRVYDIESFEDDLWFATDAHLVRVGTESGEIESFICLSRYEDTRALAVNETIVAYASDRGVTIIYYRDKHRTTREFTTDDGLPSSYVYSLLMDGDFIWIGSDLGLTRFWWNNPSRVD